MAPGFSRDEVTDPGFIVNVLLWSGPDFASYHAPVHCDPVYFPDKLEAFHKRVEVFAVIAVGAFVEIMEINFRHVARVLERSVTVPAAIFCVRFHYEPCQDVVFRCKIGVSSILRVTFVVTIEEPGTAKMNRSGAGSLGLDFFRIPTMTALLV